MLVDVVLVVVLVCENWLKVYVDGLWFWKVEIFDCEREIGKMKVLFDKMMDVWYRFVVVFWWIRYCECILELLLFLC